MRRYTLFTQKRGDEAAEDYYDYAVEAMEQVTATFNEAGLDANLEILPTDRYVERSFSPPGSPDHPQALSYVWFSGYPAASEFLAPEYGCGANVNVTGSCDRSVDRRIEESRFLQKSDPGAATRAWIRLELDLVDAAALVSVANPTLTFVVPERAGNVRINPQFGVLLSQVWVR
jgi:ABC-type transport system substrate-binding protein